MKGGLKMKKLTLASDLKKWNRNDDISEELIDLDISLSENSTEEEIRKSSVKLRNLLMKNNKILEIKIKEELKELKYVKRKSDMNINIENFHKIEFDEITKIEDFRYGWKSVRIIKDGVALKMEWKELIRMYHLYSD